MQGRRKRNMESGLSVISKSFLLFYIYVNRVIYKDIYCIHTSLYTVIYTSINR